MSALPRRAMLGARLPPDAQAFCSEGMRIEGVAPGSMAEAAGLAPGDVVTSIAGAPVRSLCELAAALRRAGAQSEVNIRFARAGASGERRVSVQKCPTEKLEGQRVEYGQLETSGARLRTILTAPIDSSPRAMVLVLQGIACESIDVGGDADHPLAFLVRAWGGAGIAALRIDKHGVGDSEGGPCSQLDFDTELGAYRAALELARERASDSGAKLVLFGHSVGGMVAPLVAAKEHVDAAMIYGSSTVPWIDCVLATTRRQLAMRKVAPDEIAAHIDALQARIWTEGISGRSAAYHRQLQAVDLRSAWRRANIDRTLVLRGGYDWVVGAAEQAEIAEIRNTLRPKSATILDLPGLDHLLGWHESRADSVEAYGAGRGTPELGAATAEWILVSSPHE